MLSGQHTSCCSDEERSLGRAGEAHRLERVDKESVVRHAGVSEAEKVVVGRPRKKIHNRRVRLQRLLVRSVERLGCLHLEEAWLL